MKKTHLALLLLAIIICNVGIVAAAANYTTTAQQRVYFTEDTAIPIELYLILISMGVIFLIVSFLTVNIIPPIFAFASFSAAAFASPMVGFFDYQTVQTINSTTGNVTLNIVPVVSLAVQPWAMWLLWGMATISFLAIVRVILIYFIELKEVEETGKWI